MSELTYEFDEQPLSVFEADAVGYRILDLEEKLKREREAHRKTRQQLTSVIGERDRRRSRIRHFENVTKEITDFVEKREKMRDENERPELAAALRHCVYSDLLDRLPLASLDQTREFLTNLYLPAECVNPRFLMLKVSPEIGETPYRGFPLNEIVRQLEKKYGDDLYKIAGFYRGKGNELKLNLPTGCAFYGYRSELGFYNGILCQPLDTLDVYFLLSSVRFGGQKAIRLTDADRAFFETGKTHRRAA